MPGAHLEHDRTYAVGVISLRQPFVGLPFDGLRNRDRGTLSIYRFSYLRSQSANTKNH